MPYPTHVSVVTVTGTWKGTDGTPASGYVTFTPNTRLQDGIDSTLIEMTPLTVLLVNGAISVQVMATDDTDLSPAGWAYTVTENITGQQPLTYVVQFPAAQTPVDLSTKAPLVPAPGLVGYVALSAVAAPSGVASLDNTGNVPLSQLGNAPSGGGGNTPSSTVVASTSFGQASAAGSLATYSRGDHVHGTPPLPTPAAIGAVPTSQLGAASGVATLDSGGKLTSSQIPAIAITEYLGAVGSQAAMLALVGQIGDWCTRTDLGTNWIITGSDPTQLGSWTQLTYPTAPVVSVNGQTGAVTLSAGNVGAVPTARQVIAGTGLTGGGDLSADRTLAVTYGTAAGTAAQGNDGRIVGAAPAASPTFTGTATFSGRRVEAIHDLGNSGTGTITPDASVGNFFKVTITGNCALAAPSNPPAGAVQHLMVEAVQDGTGGHTMALSGIGSGTTIGTPTLSTGAGKRDLLGLFYDGTSWSLIAYALGY